MSTHTAVPVPHPLHHEHMCHERTADSAIVVVTDTGLVAFFDDKPSADMFVRTDLAIGTTLRMMTTRGYDERGAR